MGRQTVQPAEIWSVVRRQHGVITRRQLLAFGMSGHAIDHRIKTRRLHPLWRGVFAVGRSDLTHEGLYVAAVLACGDGAALSHESAAWLWGIVKKRGPRIEVSVPAARNPRQGGIKAYRRVAFTTTRHHGVPITTPTQTLIDLSPRLDDLKLERAVNEAANRDLIDIDRLREDVAHTPGRLRTMLERDALTLTDSELEQLFIPIARAAGLPMPLTQAYVNSYRVDFYWPDLRIVVEADSLRFHRTPAQQRRGVERDHAHSMAGLIPLRFTHAQIAYEPRYVRSVLDGVADRVRAAA
jgi:very-short-patch-repair endonuclease